MGNNFKLAVSWGAMSGLNVISSAYHMMKYNNIYDSVLEKLVSQEPEVSEKIITQANEIISNVAYPYAHIAIMNSTIAGAALGMAIYYATRNHS